MTSPIGLEVPAAPAGQVAKHSALLAVSAGLVGVLSYLCTLLMAHLLPTEQYTQYAAAQMLVGIVGIVAHALVPLPLAALVRRHAHRTDARREGMAFAVLVSAAAGTVAGLLTGGIAAAFAPAHVAVATGVASLVLFTVAPAQGWLQGELRFTRYAVASILEVAVRLGFSAVAVLLGWGPAGALLGFAVGGLVLVAGPLAMLRDVGWHPHVLREGVRWAETGDIALVQFVVSVLVGADVVLVAPARHRHRGRGRLPGAGHPRQGPGVRGVRHRPGGLPAAARRRPRVSRTCWRRRCTRSRRSRSPPPSCSPRCRCRW